MTSWESFLYSESRAVYRGAKKAEALLGRGALLTGHMKLERPMWDAVSYTHLDVYKRQGAEEVYIVYRRSEKELPARLEEIHHCLLYTSRCV